MNFFAVNSVAVFIKKFILLFISYTFAASTFAQINTLQQFNQQRHKISSTGLKYLAGYATANIIYGTIAASGNTGTKKYFHQMNAIWNGVTIGIVTIGHLSAKKEGILSYKQSLQKQHTIQKIFLFNTGLDLAYIAGGAYLIEKSKTALKNPGRLKGYGQSVMLQGTALLLFDAIMYALHNRHGKTLYAMAQKIQIASSKNAVGIMIKL